jgi:putative YhdH/YhfP family quinone oxidoreductase
MSFKAYLINQEDGKVVSNFATMDDSQLDPGEVSIGVSHSSINYKDALAATGAGRIIRRFPCVGGIDLAGHVDASSDSRFQPGDAVIATSYDIGVAHHGGYAERARVPAGWVVKLPAGLSLAESMALGTAGFTAALAVVRMEHNGLKPANGPVIVSGATGGVGSIAIEILASLGYHVVALTGKETEVEYLKGLGAKEVMLRQSLDLTKIKPLGKESWAGAVDNLGGDVLAWMASTMQVGGTLASIGLAASFQLNTTVMPFILRGVSLLGIDSVNCPMPLRAEVWRKLATDMKPPHLAAMTRHIPFAGLPAAFDDYVAGRVRGRVVVDIAA